ncbi:MAG: sigma-70 family RNA polymerase sigma factor [Phycisphaerales bacterium]
MGKTPNEMTDPQLVEACLDGDDGAWTALVDRYAALVYSIPTRQGLGEDLSQDVFQNVWTITIRYLGALRDPQGLAAWLITTTQRETWRVARRASQQPGPGYEDLSEVAWADPAEAELLEERQRLRRSLARLDDRCRALLTEVFREDRPSYDLLAERLSIPRGSIGPTRGRCLEKLRTLVAEDDTNQLSG